MLLESQHIFSEPTTKVVTLVKCLKRHFVSGEHTSSSLITRSVKKDRDLLERSSTQASDEGNESDTVLNRHFVGGNDFAKGIVHPGPL